MVAQEATRLAGVGLSPRDIAARLGLNKSTVTRWIATGKLSKPQARRRRSAPPRTRSRQSPSAWAAAIRKAYDLDATDDQLVTLAEATLGLAMDKTAAPHVRMNAAGRFQSIARQLAVVTRRSGAELAGDSDVQQGEAKTVPVARVLRHRSGDPRAVLMAVK